MQNGQSSIEPNGTKMPKELEKTEETNMKEKMETKEIEEIKESKETKAPKEAKESDKEQKAVVTADPPPITFRVATLNVIGEEKAGTQKYFTMPAYSAHDFDAVCSRLSARLDWHMPHFRLFAQSDQGVEMLSPVFHDNDDWKLGVLQPFIGQMKGSKEGTSEKCLNLWVCQRTINPVGVFSGLKERLRNEKKMKD